MILFRAYVVASNQETAEAIASDYLRYLKRMRQFKIKLVQPYWKCSGQYEVLLECTETFLPQDKAISELVVLFGVDPQLISGTEVIWADLTESFPLAGTKWAHAELI